MQMTQKDKIIKETNDAQKRMTDLQDMLNDGVSAYERRVIKRKMNVLSDIIFYNQEYLSSLENVA
jgi:hypothetical protein